MQSGRDGRGQGAVSMKLSVVIPTLDEEAVIAATLAAAAPADEVIVVDGGSRDATVALARSTGARVIAGPRGRGLQLQQGARLASGELLVFVHADTLLPAGFPESIGRALTETRAEWGRFDLRFDREGLLLRLIAWLISTRSRLTKVATGDQAMFVTRELFDRVGGFREPLLFEDVDLSLRLRAMAPMAIPRGYVVTSARRWRGGGTWRTTFLMWSLKLLYFAGVPSERLARYYGARR